MYCDVRVPGLEKWYLQEPPHDPMRVPEEIRKSVAFVGYRDSGGAAKLAGTTFFVARKAGDTGLVYTYAVTAAHVILAIVKRGTKPIIRINLKAGGSRWIETDAWAVHPNFNTEHVDVAFTAFVLDVEADHKSYPIEGLASPETLRNNEIGVGDDVFLTGLFYPHSGSSRNIPIVRVGNIAAMPEEPVSTRMGEMNAYLIETRSIGGLSGSPVFLNLGFHRVIAGEVRANIKPQHTFFMLGLMHGHFELPALNATAQPELRERLNMGIGIVVPANKIHEALSQSGVLRLEAEKTKKMRDQQASVVPDSIEKVEVNEADHPFTKEDFESALKKVSRKLTQDD